MKMIWNNSGRMVSFRVDGVIIKLRAGSILCATYAQKVRCEEEVENQEMVLLAFNQPFYCIHTSDSEVSCSGLLFFGSTHTPVLQIPEELEHRFGYVIKALEEEFDHPDQNQEEMLRLLLKQIIIQCTRLARLQLLPDQQEPVSSSHLNVLRTFNVLVEEHYRTKKQVADYAALMYKSPKTISNIFGRLSEKTPLEIIHERIILETKRLLMYSGKSSAEIAGELGFEDPAQFSRFFKNKTGSTVTEFREAHEPAAI